MRSTMLALALMSSMVAAAPIELPTEFRNDRIYVTPTLQGERVSLYTDSGGGWNAIKRSVAERLHLPLKTEGKGDEAATYSPFPAFDRPTWIPDAPAFADNRIAVADDAMFFTGDGFLGARWFADRVWEIDYPRQRLRVFGAGDDVVATVHASRLGFQVDDTGARTMHFPRIPITVDGESLEMLFDTGAMITTTDASNATFDVAPDTQVGSSFIASDVFARWHAKHPDWLVVDAGDRIERHTFRLIRVPAITIAGHVVGPVWFAERPAANFRQYMSQMMDLPIAGALGGSALRYFRVVIDYPNAVAYFHRDFE